MVINTNIHAIKAARHLNTSQTMLGRSLARLSSGDKIQNPSDDAAGLAVSEQLKSQMARVRAADTNVQNAISYVQTADGFMEGMSGMLTRMSELTMLAKDVTKNSSDVALYNREFNALREQLRSTIGGNFGDIDGTGSDFMVQSGIGTFNGISIFNLGAPLEVTIGEDAGQTLQITNINLGPGSTLENGDPTPFALLLADITGHAESNLSVGHPQARGLLIDSIQQLASERARLGSIQSRLDAASSQLRIQAENLEQSISRIRDVDIAEETTDYARNQILVQSGTSMLAQANQLPQNVLRLLQ